MRTNTVDMTSFVYFGGYDDNADDMIGKIGETFKTMQEREKGIRTKAHNDKYHMYACLLLINTTQAQRRQVESDMRAGMENFGVNIGNDHFRFPLKVAKKKRTIYYKIYAFFAMLYAIDSCEKHGFEYHFSWVK